MLLQRRVPAILLKRFASIIGNKNLLKQSRKWVAMLDKAEVIHRAFQFFVSNAVVFETSAIERIAKRMSARDKKIFFWDITEVDWDVWCQYFGWGMRTYVLKEKNAPQPALQAGQLDILPTQRPGFFAKDIFWAFNNGQIQKIRKFREMK